MTGAWGESVWGCREGRERPQGMGGEEDRQVRRGREGESTWRDREGQKREKRPDRKRGMGMTSGEMKTDRYGERRRERDRERE